MAIKKIKIMIIVLMITFLPGSVLKADPMFPEITGWQKGEIAEKEIHSSKSLQGTWSRTTFTEKGGHRSVDMTILSGRGFGSLKIYPGIDRSDRPVGSGSTYRTLMVAKSPAILEYYPHVGIALSSSIKENITVIFESNAVDERTLIEFSEKALKTMSN